MTAIDFFFFFETFKNYRALWDIAMPNEMGKWKKICLTTDLNFGYSAWDITIANI